MSLMSAHSSWVLRTRPAEQERFSFRGQGSATFPGSECLLSKVREGMGGGGRQGEGEEKYTLPNQMKMFSAPVRKRNIGNDIKSTLIDFLLL